MCVHDLAGLLWMRGQYDAAIASARAAGDEGRAKRIEDWRADGEAQIAYLERSGAATAVLPDGVEEALAPGDIGIRFGGPMDPAAWFGVDGGSLPSSSHDLSFRVAGEWPRQRYEAIEESAVVDPQARYAVPEPPARNVGISFGPPWGTEALEREVQRDVEAITGVRALALEPV